MSDDDSYQDEKETETPEFFFKCISKKKVQTKLF